MILMTRMNLRSIVTTTVVFLFVWFLLASVLWVRHLHANGEQEQNVIQSMRASLMAKDPNAYNSFFSLQNRMQVRVVRALMGDSNENIRANSYQLMLLSPKIPWDVRYFKYGLTDKSWLVRYGAAEAAASLRRTECLAALCDAYAKEDNLSDKTGFAKAMVTMGDTSCLERLIESSTKRPEKESWLLVFSLFLQKKLSESEIEQQLKVCNPETRVFAAGMVAYFEDPAGLSILSRLCDDENTSVRDRARAIFARLKATKNWDLGKENKQVD